MSLPIYGEVASPESPQGEGVFVFPASLEQIRYWTLDQLDGASTASNMAIAARLEGPVDDTVVERAIRAIVERHEALRTTFRIVEGSLAQVISEDARYNFSVTDLRSLPESERAAAAETAVEDHSHARADLAAGPAFFVRLIHITDERHFLAFTMHHIVCDGWSNGILIRDFTDFYKAFAENREPQLAELPFQFADFTVWQQNWLESDAARDALAYWRKHIRREMPAVDLPTDRPRLPQKSYPGHIESSLLTPELTNRLKAYCRAHGATMHQVLLAAFEGLISRYANQSEFLLGSTIANRTQPGMENVVGRFANPQVILADVNGDPTYGELVDRVLAWSTESYAHQDLPFSRLMEEFQLDQAGATSQFLQVYFVYQKAFMQPQEAPGLKVVPRPSVSGGVNFDLLVSIVERAEGPRLQMEYNTVLFKKERILGLIEMYLRVLNAVMDNDAVHVSELPLIAPSAQIAEAPVAATAIALAASEATEAASVPLIECIEEQALRLGNSPAILSADTRLSWNALIARSRTMAAALESLGVQPGQTVALRLETGVNDAAAALALLRIGAVALPLSAASTPPEWTSLLAAHQPVIALASASFAATVAGVTGYESLLDAKYEKASASLPYPSASSTSWLGLRTGADGQLTAIPATHHATLRSIQSAAVTLDMRAGDIVLVTPASSATDAWVDLLLPLTAGATLFYPDTRQAAPLQSLLDQQQVSFAFASPAAVLTALHERWAGDRRINVVVRGEVLSNTLAARLTSAPCRLWSMLSTPETAGPIAVGKALPAEDSTEISIHFPASATGAGQLTILDDNGQPVPAGVSGELTLIEGNRSIATGYLARHDAGSSTFSIVDTVSRRVRLHGYRLRLGELEDLVWQNPAVADADASLLSIDGNPTLALYFRTFDRGGDAERAVRSQFQKVAPGHLAGAELISVDSIARRADGSADLASLPAPGAIKPSEAATDEYVPPRDALEAQLVGIWEDVLGVRPVGIRTPFFKLGGYSLMIVRLFARINKALGTALPITTIFNAPTVEQLADIVRGRAYYSSLVPVQTAGTKPPFFMIHSYLLYQGIPRVMGDDYPFYGLRELDTDAEDMSVEQRATAYLDAIRSVQPTGPYYIGGWCAAGPLAVETARQITAAGEKVGFLVLFDSWRPGYSAELAREQAGTKEMTLGARLGRKFRFHRNRWRTLSTAGRFKYVAAVFTNKFSSVKNRFYLKNWAIAEMLCKRFGLSLPHFMHNVSLTTLNSLKEYKGIEPFAGSMTLIRAEQAPYFPGARENCGWDAIVQGGVNVMWAPGDHESMFLDPHLQKVGELLRKSLSEAYARQA